MATETTASSSASRQQEQEQIADSNAATATNATTTTTTTTNNNNNSNNTEDDPQDASEPMSVDDAEPEPQQQQQQKQPHQSPDSKKQTSGSSTTAASEQKRPMNAFLLFCKQQRSLVREKHPNLENREITRILGEWWSKLDKEQKSKYTDLARQHKQAFMEANPDFKWCKTTITPPQATAIPAGSNIIHNNNNNNISTNNNYDESGGYAATALNSNNNHINNHHFKSSIATQEQSPYLPSLGDLHQHHNQSDNSSIGRSAYTSNNSSRQLEAPKPPKKRYLERNETVYSRNSNNHNANTTKNDTSIDVFGLYLSLDEGLIKSKKIDEVIEEVLLEKSNDSPAAGSNMCKDSPSSNNHWPPSIEIRTKPSTTIYMDTISSSSSSTIATTATSSSSSNSNGCEEEKPVDLSKKDEMCTFKNQNIIDITIDKAYSGASDKGTSRSSDAVGSVHGQFGPTNRKINTEVT